MKECPGTKMFSRCSGIAFSAIAGKTCCRKHAGYAHSPTHTAAAWHVQATLRGMYMGGATRHGIWYIGRVD